MKVKVTVRASVFDVMLLYMWASDFTKEKKWKYSVLIAWQHESEVKV